MARADKKYDKWRYLIADRLLSNIAKKTGINLYAQFIANPNAAADVTVNLLLKELAKRGL